MNHKLLNFCYLITQMLSNYTKLTLLIILTKHLIKMIKSRQSENVAKRNTIEMKMGQRNIKIENIFAKSSQSL